MTTSCSSTQDILLFQRLDAEFLHPVDGEATKCPGYYYILQEVVILVHLGPRRRGATAVLLSFPAPPEPGGILGVHISPGVVQNVVGVDLGGQGHICRIQIENPAAELAPDPRYPPVLPAWKGCFSKHLRTFVVCPFCMMLLLRLCGRIFNLNPADVPPPTKAFPDILTPPLHPDPQPPRRA